MRLRTHLVALVLAAVVPVLVFAGAMALLFAKEQRRETERGLQETTRALAMAVDRELASAVAVLEALATSGDLEAGVHEDFRAHAVRALSDRVGWSSIALFDRSGRLVIATKQPKPAIVTDVSDRPFFRSVVSTGRPAVSGHITSRITSEPKFIVGVPVRRAGQVSGVLTAGIAPDVVAAVLTGQRLPSDWVGAVVDADGVILARTRAAERYVGRPATPTYALRARAAGEDVFRGESADDASTYTAFSHVPSAGWTVALAVPAAIVDGPVRRSVTMVLSGGLVTLAFGLALALIVGRRIAQPLGTLLSSAPTLGRGDPFPAVGGDVTEVSELGRALRAASSERLVFESALAASERRLRRVVESHVVGVVFVEGDGTVVDANEAFLLLTGYSRDDVAARRVGLGALTPPEYAQVDAHAAAETREQGWHRPYEKELVRRDGERVPVMMAGAVLEPGSDLVIGFVHDLRELRRVQSERERVFALLDALTASAPVGYAAIDRELRYVLVNDVLAEVNGVPAAQHVGRTAREVVPHIAAAIEPLQRRVLETGQPVLNVELQDTRGSEGWQGRHYLASYYPVRARSGEVLGVGVVVVDITQRKRGEQRLAAQGAVTRILAEADSLEDAAPRLLHALCQALDSDFGEVWRVDDSGLLQRVQALHLGPASAAPQDGGMLLEHADLLARMRLTGKPVWVEDIDADLDADADAAPSRRHEARLHAAVAFPILHGDIVGAVVCYAREAREADAEVLEMLASIGSQIGQFIERRRAEQERRRLLTVTERALRDAEASERRYRLFVEALPLLAWTARPDGTMDYLSRHWCEYTGLPLDAHGADAWLDALHPDDVEGTLGHWRDAREEARGDETEFRVRRRDGAYRWFLARLEPVRDADGAVVTWLGIAIDIDAQKRAELGAVDANRAKDTFLATLSHELRTPLTAMLGWVRLLRTGRLDALTTTRALETIERNVKLQAQMVDELLDVSRIVTGKIDLRIVPIDLARLLEQAVDGVRPSAEAKNVALSLKVEPGRWRSAGDAARLLQVLGNLLTNAIKFTERGGRVDVRLERRGTRARVSVRDTGKGIAPELLPHVFDRFRQGERRTAPHTGLGLGLAIVKQLVELHGGTVYATSEGEGRGATFAILLALADDERG